MYATVLGWIEELTGQPIEVAAHRSAAVRETGCSIIYSRCLRTSVVVAALS
jgi:hypothetical protein